ncbi:MAG: branched-chain-amino-acid transaminase [Elusimicrobiota bacterium]
MKIYIDGEFYDREKALVSVYDHGLLYGDGVFEGIRAYGGRVFRLKEHVERLYASAKAILLDIPVPPEEMSRLITEAVRINGLKDAYIRAIVTRGVGDLGLDLRKCPKPSVIVIVDKIALYPEEAYRRGLKVIVASLRRTPPDTLSPLIKSLNYLNNVLARAEAIRAGCDEAILLNREGYVAECTGDNIFFIRKDVLFTPPVFVGILEGVTRGVAMDLARRKLCLDVREQVFTPTELYGADEVFLTGTGAEIIGVSHVDGRKIGEGRPGPVTKKLVAAFREHALSLAAEGAER